MDVDDARALNGLTSDTGSRRQVERSQHGQNDLEDHGGGAAWVRPRRREEDAQDETARTVRHPTGGGHPVADEPTPHLVQALDRMRTTGEGVSGTDRVRRLRGQKHYRDDPTTGFYSRSSTGAPSGPAAPPSDALERKEPEPAPQPEGQVEPEPGTD